MMKTEITEYTKNDFLSRECRRLKWSYSSIPNQELLGAKSELQGETEGVCSSYKRGGQPPYNSALRSLQMCLLVHV